jgi:hypothetical protein
MDQEVTEPAERPRPSRLSPTVHLTASEMREVLEEDPETRAPPAGG